MTQVTLFPRLGQASAAATRTLEAAKRDLLPRQERMEVEMETVAATSWTALCSRNAKQFYDILKVSTGKILP